MKIIKEKNKYRKAKWYEEHENLACTLICMIFWAVVLTAYFI